jgi:uncharacterized protein YfkK (UPF0435 family)
MNGTSENHLKSNLMDKSAVEKLKKHQSKITEILQLVETKEAFSVMEKDLILQHLRDMYEVVLEIKTDKITEAPVKEVRNEEVKRVEPIKVKPEPAKTFVEEPKKPKEKEVEQPKPQEMIIELESTAKEEVQETSQVHETQEHQQQSKQILAEKFAKPEPLLHDVVAQKVSVTDLSTKFQQKEIASLTQSIQINDRFLFIKELFGDDTKLYSESLQKIDEMNSEDEAVSFLKNEINIDLEKEAAKKLLQLLNRKFGNV